MTDRIQDEKLTKKAVVRVEDLTVRFGETVAADSVNLEVYPGEILGIVGESGSGKSVTALTMMGLVSDSAVVETGRITFGDTVLAEAGRLKDKMLYRSYQGERMSMIFQEPMTSLNPTKKVGAQVEEMLILHTDLAKEERRKKVCDRFAEVGLKEPEKLYGCYPHQLSGGMRQRVMIAMATILHPDLIVADEPTTALDVTIQNQVIELLRRINETEKNAMIFITHDLNLAKRICNRVVVMKNGKVVESGDTKEVFEHPEDEYTKRLVAAVPSRQKAKAATGQQAGTQTGENGAETSAENSDRKALENVIEIENLSVFYADNRDGFFGHRQKRAVVSDASFVIRNGETLGLVGESGCGKSSLSKAILGMNKDIKGSIRHFSVRPQMIFQDPYSSLNPCKTVEWLLAEPLRAAGEMERSKRLSKEAVHDAVCDMLYKVGLDESYLNRRPSQLSGGQRQRISIGQALITKPKLVIADEPVSALDVTLQAQIMELMRSLQEEMGVAYLFISHDINVVYQMSDRIMVMKDGRIIEQGETMQIFEDPKEDYTKLLLRES